MGIKGWLAIGGAVLSGAAVWLGLKKKEDEHYEKIQKMICDVDQKESEEKTETEEEPKTVEELKNDVNEAISGMDIDEDDAKVTEKQEKLVKEAEEKLLRQEQMLKEANDRLQETAEKLFALERDVKDINWIKEQEKQLEEAKEKEEADFKRKVKKAVEQKNFSRLEDLFDSKYAGGPWHPSPESVFRDAKHDGLITDEFYKMAEEHFGKLWCYSGD